MRLSRLLGPVVLAPAVVGVAYWLWQRWGYPVREHDRTVPRPPDPPIHPAPEAPGDRHLQTSGEGTGPRFHRTYRVTIASPTLSPEALMERVQADIQAFVPDELARFEKVKGEEGTFEVGHEFDIHISSPWDGPVRVIECDARSFAFGTLDGHMEAGQIEFRAEASGADRLRFTIESWARSRDATVDLVYNELGLAKAAQQGMWTFFCKQVADACGGDTVGEIEVVTEREADG